VKALGFFDESLQWALQTSLYLLIRVCDSNESIALTLALALALGIY
jgi:hypothetical protein